MYNLKQLDQGRQNNFDLIRLFAAIFVIYGHSYLVTNNFTNDPLLKWTGFLSFGEVGVSIFFTISGYLVSKSLLRQPTLGRFVWARALRIFPALFICGLVCAFVIGPLATTLSLDNYFTTRSVYGFVWRLTLQHNFQNMLPGVFANNPYPYHVDGSLWTLLAEMMLYMGMTILGAGALLWRKNFAALRKNIPMFIVLFLFFATATYTVGYIKYVLMWGCFFFTGACFNWLSGHLLLSLRVLLLWLVICLALQLFVKADAVKWAFNILIVYSVFVFAYHPKLQLKKLSGHADISYGLYIYAMPIQQFLVMKQPGSGVWSNFLLTMLLVTPLAIASWFYIEKPALSLKKIPLGLPSILNRIKQK